MKVNIFGHDVDIMNAVKVAAIVASVFSLNSIQENQINNYVKLRNYEWAEKRKRDSEIETLIREQVYEIK